MTVFGTTTIFCRTQKKIRLYKTLHVSTFKRHHQEQIYKKDGRQISWIVIPVKEISLLQLYKLQLTLLYKNQPDTPQ